MKYFVQSNSFSFAVNCQSENIFCRLKTLGRKIYFVVTNFRYKNILPFDHTRVILMDTEGCGTDYINANR
jgi:protein tyrosine phosphatase